MLEEYGYGFLPIEQLPETWTTTCWLRFISSADLKERFVGQGEPARFEGWDIDPDTADALETMAAEAVLEWV